MDSAAIMRSPSFSRSWESRTMINSPFSTVSHRQSHWSSEEPRMGRDGHVNRQNDAGNKNSLKAAIVSSIESNCCAISVVEGILGDWYMISEQLISPLTARVRGNWRNGGERLGLFVQCVSSRYVPSLHLKTSGLRNFQKVCLPMSVIADRPIRNARDARRGAGSRAVRTN